MSSAPAPRSTPAPHVVRPFRAPWWLRGAHAQTIGGKLFRRPPRMALRRERISTPDGDFLDLDFAAEIPGAPFALVLHGLEGSATRLYMRQTYAALARRGIAAAGLNFRSCSGSLNRTARFYHSGETEDLRHVLRLLRRRWPDRPFGAIGFSLGGNVLLKFLAEEACNPAAVLSAAVAISVPYDLDVGGRMLERWPMGRFYARYFLRMLKPKAAALRDRVDSRCDLRRVARARTFRDFDDAFTAPLHGFRDAQDYYDRCSSYARIPEIRVPTLLVHAADDPFLPEPFLPVDSARANPWISLALARRGGHVGFIEGSPFRPRCWAEEEAARFLALRLLPADPAAESF